jgi:hypothetical protein
MRFRVKEKLNIVSVNAFALSFDTEANIEAVPGMPMMESIPFEIKIDGEDTVHSDYIVIPCKP